MVPQPSMSPNAERRVIPTILVVEDEVLLRLNLPDLFRDENVAVIEAANADEAVAVLQTSTVVDVVVTDFAMPGTRNGAALARFVRERRPEVKVIMTSGNLLRPLPDCPLDGFVPKPYIGAELIHLIRSLLQQNSSGSSKDSD